MNYNLPSLVLGVLSLCLVSVVYGGAGGGPDDESGNGAPRPKNQLAKATTYQALILNDIPKGPLRDNLIRRFFPKKDNIPIPNIASILKIKKKKNRNRSTSHKIIRTKKKKKSRKPVQPRPKTDRQKLAQHIKESDHILECMPDDLIKYFLRCFSHRMPLHVESSIRHVVRHWEDFWQDHFTLPTGKAPTSNEMFSIYWDNLVAAGERLLMHPSHGRFLRLLTEGEKIKFYSDLKVRRVSVYGGDNQGENKNIRESTCTCVFGEAVATQVEASFKDMSAGRRVEVIRRVVGLQREEDLVVALQEISDDPINNILRFTLKDAVEAVVATDAVQNVYRQLFRQHLPNYMEQTGLVAKWIYPSRIGEFSRLKERMPLVVELISQLPESSIFHCSDLGALPIRALFRLYLKDNQVYDLDPHEFQDPNANTMQQLIAFIKTKSHLYDVFLQYYHQNENAPPLS